MKATFTLSFAPPVDGLALHAPSRTATEAAIAAVRLSVVTFTVSTLLQVIPDRCRRFGLPGCFLLGGSLSATLVEVHGGDQDHPDDHELIERLDLHDHEAVLEHDRDECPEDGPSDRGE